MGREFFQQTLRTLNKGSNLDTRSLWPKTRAGSCLRTGRQVPSDTLSPKAREGWLGSIRQDPRDAPRGRRAQERSPKRQGERQREEGNAARRCEEGPGCDRINTVRSQTGKEVGEKQITRAPSR